MKTFVKITKYLFLFFLFFTLTDCKKKEIKQDPPSFLVKTTKSISKDALIYTDTIGHVDPIISVEVRSRIEGELKEVYFTQGEEVKKDDLIFLIDPRPYEITLERAKAVKQENLANLRLAKDKLFRYTPLLKDEYVSELDYDSMQAEVDRYTAMISQNDAEIKEAQTNLDYCYIHSPLNGKTGILKIDRGNLISADGQDPLISINQIAPIFVTFSVAEKELRKIHQYLREKTIKVRVAFDSLEKDYIDGDIFLVDNAVDTQTGMITLRGIFTNEDKELWPGEYVNVRLIYTKKPNSVVIPYQAVQNTTTGPVVYVVKKDKTVDMRRVTLGQRENGDIIVLKGLKANETIVIEGQINLIPGAHVTIAKKEPKQGEKNELL